MLMRLVAGVSLLAGMATFAGASERTEADISAALGALRIQPELHVAIAGSTARGAATQQWQTDLFFKKELVGPNTVIHVEVVEFDIDMTTGVPVKTVTNRMVGDGLYLYRYSPKLKQSSAIQYGNVYGANGDTYQSTLFNYLQQGATARSAYAIRLLRDTMDGSESLYRPWLPGVVPDLTVEDRVLYSQAQGATSRSLTFSFQHDDTPLTVIDWTQSRPVGPATITDTWQMQFYETFDAEYPPFIPLTRAQMVGWTWSPWLGLAKLTGN